jgi:hypothetical protein
MNADEFSRLSVAILVPIAFLGVGYILHSMFKGMDKKVLGAIWFITIASSVAFGALLYTGL